MRHREIVLFGPGKNALGLALMESTRRQIEDAAGAPLLLRGEGGAFSAGLNIKEVCSLDANGLVRFLGALDDLVSTLFTYPGPTVACIDGHAIAGGCVLALACDLRIAEDDESLKIGLNETANGLVFPPRVLALVRARVPPGSVDRVVLEAGLYNPRQAFVLGLVDEVVRDAPGVARARVEALARHPPDAYARNKQALRADGLLIPPDEDERFVQETIPLWASAETKARLSAALKK
jgi:enoyl-CoA hydratase/carnithine racemase